MRVFVTGAGGFVGSRLVPRLQAEGYATRGSDREVDVTSQPAIEDALAEAKPDAIIHLAALSSVAQSANEPMACFRTNFLGSLNLLAAVERCTPRARVLLVSSGDVYGTGPADAPPYVEGDPLLPRSPYARSKAAAEQLGARAAQRGMDVVRVRPFNHIGPGQTDRFVASSFAQQLCEMAAGKREPRMRVGNLESVRDFMHVDDVIDAYLRLLDPAVPAALYNISSGVGLAVGALLDQLIELAGIDVDVETDPARWRPTDHLVGNAQRLEQATGWRPRASLRSTLSSILADWSRPAEPAPSATSE
jgi:GDP-4-dehydro-6-deoxy-D-mannose reductase